MIYFFHGGDNQMGRSKAHALIQALKKKRAEAEIFRITLENWNEAFFENLLAGQGLFENHYVVLMDNILGREDIKDFVLERLKDIAKVAHVFIVLENDIDKKSIALVSKVAHKTEEFAPKAKAQTFNTFSLTDAFGARDRKSLWVLYQKALREGIAPEEIHGVLFWQAKSLLLASTYPTAEGAKLSPFVFSKAKRNSARYSPQELRSNIEKLLLVLEEGRDGSEDTTSALERFILTV